MSETDESPTLEERGSFSIWLNKVERFYLFALRALALIFATFILGAAAWFAVSGLYKSYRDASDVETEEAVVETRDITQISEVSENTEKSGAPAAKQAKSEPSEFAKFQQRYYGLYKAQFATSLKPDDKAWSQAAFNDEFLMSEKEWNRRVKDGDINLFQALADYQMLYEGMEKAAKDEVTLNRIKAYKSAVKVSVTRTVTEMKTERYCSYYSSYFEYCYSWESRQVPVKKTVTEKKLPKGVYSPNDLFKTYHHNFWSKLEANRSKNEADAATKRNEIVQGNIEGKAQVMTALQLLGMFGVLMFFFLLIAVERHQRKIAAHLNLD